MKSKAGRKKGFRHSIETKKKMRLAKLGKKQTSNHIAKRTKGRKGYRHSEETKRKMGEVKKGKPQPWNQKENHWNWNEGISSEIDEIKSSIEYRLWRESVFARDGYTCQKCGDMNGGGKTVKLNAHHILNFIQYPELRTAIDNGITFCEDCHKLFHKKYGKKNNTKDQLLKFVN